MRQLVTHALQSDPGIEVAGSAALGLAKITDADIDLVLLDLSLPDEDGVALIRRLRGWMRRPTCSTPMSGWAHRRLPSGWSTGWAMRCRS